MGHWNKFESRWKKVPVSFRAKDISVGNCYFLVLADMVNDKIDSRKKNIEKTNSNNNNSNNNNPPSNSNKNNSNNCHSEVYGCGANKVG